MGTWKILLAILAILLLMNPLWSFGSVGEALVAIPFEGMLPTDAQLGALADPYASEHPVYALTFAALDGVYGPDWFDRHVHPDVRAALARLYGSLLARMLPGRPVIGTAVFRGPGIVVPVRLESPAQPPVLLDVHWEEGEGGTWRIVSLSTR